MKTLRRFAHKFTIVGLSRPYQLSCSSILTAFHDLNADDFHRNSHRNIPSFSYQTAEYILFVKG
jgi:hypothetical protein